MDLVINDGERPSGLRIDQHLTGEIDDPEVAALLAAEPDRADLDAARAAVGPFDASALRARAAVEPVAANNTRFYGLVGLLLAAVLLLVAAPLLATGPAPVDPTYVGVRGSALSVFHLQAGELRPYDDRALGEGDVLGFRVDPGAHRDVVVLSVDGTGAVSVFWPASGDDAEPVRGPGALPGTVVLDGAPGPEVFVAVFGTTVPDARDAARRAWQSGGTEGVLDWARSTGDADATVVSRK